jgi:hypothetical protein
VGQRGGEKFRPALVAAKPARPVVGHARR